MLDNLIIVIALSVQAVGAYLVWPSRWNVPAHIALGQSVAAYVIPGLFATRTEFHTAETVGLYVSVLLFGAFFYIVGLLTSKRIAFYPLTERIEWIQSHQATWNRHTIQRVLILLLISLVGLWVSFAIMGFIPALADDPLTAKQFKGTYQEPYRRVEWLFRFSFQIAVQLIPVLLTAWWALKRHSYLIISIAIVFTLILTLARGGAFLGVLVFLGLVFAHRRRGSTLIFPAICIFAFLAGSIGYLLLGLITGNTSLLAANFGSSFAELVGSGLPDISDQLDFTEEFQDHGEFTMGRTFWGGLIPNNYEWNPSVWTLSIVNPDADGDISEIVSGGLRLPVALWGYVAFGWIGVGLVPFFSGLFLGLGLKSIRQAFNRDNLILASVLMLLYQTLIAQANEFYTLSIHGIPGISAAILLLVVPTLTVKAKSMKASASIEKASGVPLNPSPQ